MSLTAHLPWVVGMARWQGSQFDLAQPDGRNQTRATAARRWQTGLQSVAAAVDCSVEHLRACSGAFRPRSRWCLASVPCLLGQQEVETQMHADKKG
jgi:hypothetical protein